jgi:hypothetical protein
MMGLFFLLSLFVIAYGDTFGVQEDDLDGSWSVLVKYKIRKVNNHIQTLRWCTDGRADCNTVYYDAPGYKFFENLEQAFEWLNHENKSHNDVYGVFQLHPADVGHVSVGTRRVTRNVPTEVEEAAFEWMRVPRAVLNIVQIKKAQDDA